MTHHEIADLADRTEAKRRRGEEWEFEFKIEFASLTAAEQEAFVALMNERIAHGKERLEAIAENVRILQLFFAHQQGALTTMEFVERVRGAVPPLRRRRDDDRSRARGPRPVAQGLSSTQGCTCDVEFEIETVDPALAPFVAAHHEDWCPLLRVEQEKPPGVVRWQVVLRPD